MRGTANIDGDVLIYRSAASVEVVSYHLRDPLGNLIETFRYKKELIYFRESRNIPDEWPEEKSVKVGTYKEAKSRLEDTLMKIRQETQTEDFRIFVGGKGNYRYDVATIKPYKGNRDRSQRPQHHAALTRFLVDEWYAEIIDGMEADDALGIHQDERSVLCTTDKDLNMIPGWHYNWVANDMFTVTYEEGMRFFYNQLLIGDPTDNIGGVKGIGKKRAEVLLKDAKTEREMYEVCLEAYKKDEDALIENGILLWMKRRGDCGGEEFREYIKDLQQDGDGAGEVEECE